MILLLVDRAGILTALSLDLGVWLLTKKEILKNNFVTSRFVNLVCIQIVIGFLKIKLFFQPRLLSTQGSYQTPAQ